MTFVTLRFWTALIVTINTSERLDHLEILFAEQEHTLQTLNDVIARQDNELRRYAERLSQIESSLKLLKESLPNHGQPDTEKPPHY